MRYFFGPDFDSSLYELYGKGQLFSSAVKKVRKCTNLAKKGKNPEEVFRGLKPTRHKEERIKKARKYNIGRDCRLVVKVEKQYVMFLFVGYHDDCERWLNRNRGTDFALDTKTNSLTKIINPSSEIHRLPKVETLILEKDVALISRIDQEDQEFLFSDATFQETVMLSNLTTSSNDDEILNAVSNASLQTTKTDAALNILLLAKDSCNKSLIKKIINQLKGTIQPLDQVDESTLDNIISKGSDQVFHLGTETGLEERLDLMKKGNYKKWMLYMHPDQKEIAEGDFEGASRLKGVSGSGKTAIIINRALNLSEKYSDEKILILTLNKPLATSIREIVEGFSKPNLEVKSLWTCFEENIKKHIPYDHPNRKTLLESYGEFTKTTDFIEERVTEGVTGLPGHDSPEESWQSFYHEEDNVHDAWETMQYVHQYLLARSIFPEQYIKEEFDYIRSNFSKEDRHKYLEMQRKGRAIPLNKENRVDLLTGLNKWYDKMFAVGNIDYLGLTSDLYRYIDQIEPIYRSILIDEEQDLGTLELAIIRKLVKENKNDIFLAGDVSQRIYTKRHDMKKANIEISNDHDFKILKNYRNSREVLEVAYAILFERLTDPNLEYENAEDTIPLEPEFAESFGYKPYLLKAFSFDEELTYGLKYIQDRLKAEPGKFGCLIIAGVPHVNQLVNLHRELKKYIRNLRILNGDATFDNQSNIYLSDLEQSKGFEFDIVVIVNCSNGTIPNPYLPKEEEFRDLSRLYIAMTRAKTDLVISYSGKPSSFLDIDDSESLFNKKDWQEIIMDIQKDGVIKIESPFNHAFAERYQMSEQDSNNNLNQLSGKELLKTRVAVGINRKRQDRLLQYITGDRYISQKPTDNTWRNLDELFKEEQVIINRILVGSDTMKPEDRKEEIQFYRKTFNVGTDESIPQKKLDEQLTSVSLAEIQPDIFSDSSVSNIDSSEVKVFSKKEKEIYNKYQIKNSKTNKWRAWKAGTCRQCGRPAYSGDYVCHSCNPE